MWGMATLAMEVSSASMKVASVTVMAMAHGLARGRHVWWKSVDVDEAVAVATRRSSRGEVVPPWGAGWCWGVLWVSLPESQRSVHSS